ncbi:MAG: hypothetical protein ABS85_06540 [Sphingobacteriales bacterium SCN 48-20]|jgi:hypothetical protein|nr:C40 family peptidase [Terrimonas ferruginea]ODT93259.1 MAG: hypothetical protein ABS85_06540 [Sphingobacteriales bacterium SCN 48-20]OJW44879.1 MAG: hypothetical protein BGO56_15610 [Sphingobacteriales bacterium 48-107]
MNVVTIKQPLMRTITLIVLSLVAFTQFSCHSSRKAQKDYSTIIIKTEDTLYAAVPEPKAVLSAEDQAIQAKYSGYLKTPPDSALNLKLYRFIDYWLHTPYLWGGTTKKGIDCSAFIQRLLSDVYAIEIPRTSVQQFFTDNIEPFGSRHYLAEGDLVFFRTMKGKVISHVGLYLGNRRFVNSSSTYGVSIANLDEPYWKSKYVAAGRVKLKTPPNHATAKNP